MKARVAKVVGKCKVEIVEEEVPPPGDGEILIRVKACGLCHSDLPRYEGVKDPTRRSAMAGSTAAGSEGVDGGFPYRIGHEVNGVVEAVGRGVSGFKEGDKVGGFVPGGFATHVVCRTGRIGIIPDGVPMDTVLAEPLMCVTNIVRAASPNFGDYAAVIGAGFMGLLVVSGLARFPVREIISIDLVDERLRLAKKMGATKTVNPQEQDVVRTVMDITGGHGVDVAVELTGRYAGLALATKIVRTHRARIVAASFYSNPEMVDIGPELLTKCPIIHSTYIGYSADYVRDLAAGLWAAETGIFPIKELITHRYRFDDINAAFRTLVKNPPGFIKGVVLME